MMHKTPWIRLIVLSLVWLLTTSLAMAAPVASPKPTVVYAATPKPVVAFYNDVMTMFRLLMKDLHAAKDSKAVAAAFNLATANANTKNLPNRYQELAKQYPEFFSDDDGTGSPMVNGGWVPPADWVKLGQELEAQMEAFGASAGNLSAFMGTAEVEAALDAFGAMMERFNPGAED